MFELDLHDSDGIPCVMITYTLTDTLYKFLDDIGLSIRKIRFINKDEYFYPEIMN